MTENDRSQRAPSKDGPLLGGPYVKMALLCEKVLKEEDGVTSLIRVVDRILLSVTGPGAPPEMPPAPVNLILVLAFVPGFARGSQRIQVRLVTPSHKELTSVELPVLFESEDRSAQVNAQLGFLAHEEGLYWFEVYVLDMLVTRVPLRVLYQRALVS